MTEDVLDQENGTVSLLNAFALFVFLQKIYTMSTCPYSLEEYFVFFRI